MPKIHKVLSVRQPFATLICSGVKDVENRTWKTKYRGQVLIHASTTDTSDLFDRSFPLPVFREYDRMLTIDGEIKAESDILYVENNKLLLKPEAKKHRREYELLKTEIAEQIDNESTLFLEHAIVGMADLVDIVSDSKSPWSQPECYHWILENAVLFANPVTEIKGHLRLWKYDAILDTSPKSFVRR